MLIPDAFTVGTLSVNAKENLQAATEASTGEYMVRTILLPSNFKERGYTASEKVEG